MTYWILYGLSWLGAFVAIFSIPFGPVEVALGGCALAVAAGLLNYFLLWRESRS